MLRPRALALLWTARAFAPRVPASARRALASARRALATRVDDDGATLPGAAFSILHEDDEIVVVDKGAGLLFVPGRQPHKADCLVARLASTRPELGVAHRLDRDTSGVCVLAKTKAALRTLGKAFQAREVRKTYVGAVSGTPAADGAVDAAIGKVPTPEGFNRVALLDEASGGRPSVTRYEVLEARGAPTEWWTRARCVYFKKTIPTPQNGFGSPSSVAPAGDSALIRLTPLTGRAHQLRVGP